MTKATKGSKGFSEEEKDLLRKKLCEECEYSWALYGYKKTSIGELTKKVGISTGAFYILYNSKEELFFDTLEGVQRRLKRTIRDIMRESPGKEGFIQSMKWQFEEYSKFPFLYDFGTPDFLSFVNRLPKARVDSLKFDSEAFFDEVIQMGQLQLKIEREKAHALISTLLYTVTIKERLEYDHFEIFDFLLKGMIDQIFV